MPFLYDWFTHHRLVWPSLTCRWGPVLERQDYKHKQRVYVSEQTDGTAPNTLQIVDFHIVQKRVASTDQMIFDEEARSKFQKKHKTIVHPGEVNKIREFEKSPNLIVTHSDAPELFVWDVDKQPGYKQPPRGGNSAAGAGGGDGAGPSDAPKSRPDLVLVGHEENAEFALAVHRDSFHVASGGKDTAVLLWDVADHDGGSIWNRAGSKPRGGESGSAGAGVGARSGDFEGAPTLAPKMRFAWHKDTVEDVSFHPADDLQLCSVGDDGALVFWDGRRNGTNPAHSVSKAHDDDVHCVDWSVLDEHLVVTGSADHTVKLWDRRKLARANGGDCCVHTFNLHTDAITTVQWCPDQRGVFASGGEDGLLNVWDVNKIGATQTPEREKAGKPEIIFQHAGHRSQIADFHWNPFDPWTMISASTGDGGNSLQIWRMNDLIYRPEEEALAELEKHKMAVCGAPKEAKEGEEAGRDVGSGGDAMVE